MPFTVGPLMSSALSLIEVVRVEVSRVLSVSWPTRTFAVPSPAQYWLLQRTPACGALRFRLVVPE